MPCQHIVTRVLLPHLNCRPWIRVADRAFTSCVHFSTIYDVTLTYYNTLWAYVLRGNRENAFHFDKTVIIDLRFYEKGARPSSDRHSYFLAV